MELRSVECCSDTLLHGHSLFCLMIFTFGIPIGVLFCISYWKNLSSLTLKMWFSLYFPSLYPLQKINPASPTPAAASDVISGKYYLGSELQGMA